jgi:hypothetical protein
VKYTELLKGIAIVALTASTAACTADETGEDVGFETWNPANNPMLVDATFKLNVKDIPVTGRAALDPIPADYWATYKDNINVRWDGESSMSAAEKYGKAFGVSGVEDAVSSNYGIDSGAGWRKSCTDSSQCADLKDGSTCAMRRGQTKGYCIPTWWGICHGWAPYAISEPAAKKPVTHNGVTFYPGDLEGLMSLVYGENLRTKFISQRCNKDNPTPPASGRLDETECRDMNPGSMMVVLGNMIGIRKKGIVEDRTYDDEVWNQPVFGYKVTNTTTDGKLKEITKSEAIKLVGLTGKSYKYNTKAKKFYHVMIGVDWIREGGPQHTSHVTELSLYTRTDNYEFVLEADSKGNIVGGEWVNGSQTNHPDFMWWPTEKPATSSVANGLITYEKVADLNRKASM